MPWFSRDKKEEEALSELLTFSDRVVGLLSPIFIDRRLEFAIKLNWRDSEDNSVFSDLFRDGGALGSFKTRVQIGFAMKLYDEIAYADLLVINKIRNAFAHRLEAKDFSSSPVKDFAAKIKLPDVYPGTHEAEAGKIFKGVRTKDAILGRLLHTTALEKIEGARDRFLRATEILVTLLWNQTGLHGRLPGR